MAARIDRLAIARHLHEMARLLGLAGEPPFKVRAYDRAAPAFERFGGDVSPLVEEGRLTELRGVGPRLAEVIAELHRTGTSRSLEELRRRFPSGAAELSRIPELSLARIETLSRTLGVETVGQLKEACEQGRLRTMKGIGPKTEQRILDRIRRLESPRRILLPEAIEIAEEMVTHLAQAPGATVADVAGDLRRATETLGSLVFVLATTRPGAAAEQIRRAPLVVSAEADGASVRGVLVDGLPYEVHVVSPRALPASRLGASAVACTRRTRRRSIGSSVFPTSRRSSGKARERSRSRSPGASPPTWSPWGTYAGWSTATPCTPTARTPSSRWPGPPTRSAWRT